MPNESADGETPDQPKRVTPPPEASESEAERVESPPVASEPPPAATTVPAAPAVAPGPAKTAVQLMEEARRSAVAALGQVGRPKVDKYFGSKLPPVCRQLGCYVTDDGKFFYCINPHCHKDKRRETKYNRRRKAVVYFFCPKCKSREIQLHLKLNTYECLDCAYSWKH